MRLVLDTNVVASALLWDGAPRQLLVAARAQRIELFTSMPLLAELTDILGRRKFEKKVAASQLTPDQLIEGYAQLAALVRSTPVPRLAPDPDDDVVIGTALAANAEFIVTGDRTLRSLIEYQHVKLVRVREALQILSS